MYLGSTFLFSLLSSLLCLFCPCLLIASYAGRVTFSSNGITFNSVTRKDTGAYTCMVSEDGGQNYGEVNIHLTVLGMCRVTSFRLKTSCSLKPDSRLTAKL